MYAFARTGRTTDTTLSDEDDAAVDATLSKNINPTTNSRGTRKKVS